MQGAVVYAAVAVPPPLPASWSPRGAVCRSGSSPPPFWWTRRSSGRPAIAKVVPFAISRPRSPSPLALMPPSGAYASSSRKYSVAAVASGVLTVGSGQRRRDGHRSSRPASFTSRRCWGPSRVWCHRLAGFAHGLGVGGELVPGLRRLQAELLVEVGPVPLLGEERGALRHPSLSASPQHPDTSRIERYPELRIWPEFGKAVTAMMPEILDKEVSAQDALQERLVPILARERS